MAGRQKPRKKRPTDDEPDDDMPGGPDPTITLIGTRFETEEETAKMTRRQREEVNKDKYVPIYKQELKDERGRKVLPQGAFKGGRVAGFNNTVGSAQGWTPSQFVSSRSNRASGGSSQQQATDFMDEEDFEEMGVGSKDVSAASDFDTFGSSRAGKTGGLEDLITPAKDSAGVRLLRLMGWREGHGIGPRKKRMPKNKKKQYGVALPPGVERDEDSDDEAVSALAAEVGVAPKNTDVMEFKPKDDHFGLGYDPYSQAPEFRAMREGRSGDMTGKPKEKQRIKMGVEYSGGADFGMSVLEGGGSAFDIYDSDNRSEYSRVIEDEPSRYDKMDYDAKKGKLTSLVATEFGEDGRPIISGFVKAHRVLQQQKFFAAPDVPRDFDPRHRVTPVNAESKLSAAAQVPQYQITPEQRGELLGEQPLKRSVFDLISKEDRERLQKFGGSVPAGAAPTNALAPPNAANEALAKLGIKTDRFASSGTHNLDEEEKKVDPNKPLAEAFGPFRFDREKQKRYEFWLRVQRGEELKPDDWKDGLTDEQRVREHDEFARVWGKFKPLSEAMAKRFTSANVMLGNEEYNDKELTEYQTDTSVQADAAKMKMFGRLTRSTEEWRPSGLLCKRFNIMNPFKGVQDWDKKKEERKAAIDIFMEMELPQFMPELAKAKEQDEVKNTNDENNKDENKDGDDKKEEENDEEEEIKEEEKPSIDLFKAIFEASDEEEDEEDENNEENNNENNETEADKQDQEQVVDETKPENEKMAVEEDKPAVPEKTEEEIRAELKEDLIKEREERMKSKLMKPLDQDTEEEEGLNFKSLTTHKKKTPVIARDIPKRSEPSDSNAQVSLPVEEKVTDVHPDQAQTVPEEPAEVIGPELPPTLMPGTSSGLSYIMPMNIESSESSDSSASSDEGSSKRRHKDKKEKRDKKHKKSKKRKHKDKKDKKDKKEKHKRKKQRTS